MQLWGTLCKSSCLSYCGLQVKHRAQPRAEHQGCVGGDWLQWDQNQRSLSSKGRLGVAISMFLSTWCTLIVPGSEKQAQWSSKGDGRSAGSVLALWSAVHVSTHWQWQQLFAAELEPHSRENSDSPGDKGSPQRTAAIRPGNTDEAKFITLTPEINLASGTMASCN